jgi:hypothetical protein
VVSKNPTRNDYVDALFSLGDSYADARIFSILDVPTWTLYIDFSSHESKQAALDTATSWTDEVEAQCPWGAKFGLTGIGEGIVWVPVGEHWGKPELCFKTKGEKHKKVHSKRESPQMDPEVLSSITEFVEFSTPESRLEQGLEVLKEQKLPLEMRSMGHFLKWVTADVQRECAAELEASGLDWKQVQGAIQIKAREFFKKATANF